MPPITVLTESDLRSCVGLDREALLAVEDGFTRLAQGKATAPPIMVIQVPEHNGEVDVKSAYVQGLESLAVKIASGFFDNPRRGLPSGSGLMVVLSVDTGFPRAVLLDNGYLTDLRTALAGAVAAKYLARESITTVGIIGAGAQGRFQARALHLVRDFRKILVFDTDAGALQRYGPEVAAELGCEVVVAPDAGSVVCGSDIVVTATPSREPVVQARWLHEGLHLTAMGSDSEAKQELEPEVLQRADRLCCDSRSQCFRLGELHHAKNAGLLDETHDITELGELAAGTRLGRNTEDEITVCDLTGVGVQDTAIALLAFRKAKQMGLGLTVGS
ncbi:MAG: cyclodeaminase [Gemmatimonadota bacterium]|nr:MAG: cyclodeaminase [Gemmatimonadota bacterium]